MSTTRSNYSFDLKQTTGVTCSAILLMAVAFYNGYPLVTSDSGSYIRHAFDFQLPADRSPFYGIFVGITGWRTTLWLTVLAQASLLAYLLNDFLRMLGLKHPAYTITYTTILIAGTPAAWITSFIMPDIFTAILLIAYLLFFFERSKLKAKILLVIILGAMLVHNSHFLIALIFSGITTFIFLITKQRDLLRRSLAISALSLFGIIGVSSLYYLKGFGFTLSPGSHIFMMGKLTETGILKKYLDEHCDTMQLKLCAYKEVLPHKAYQYLWEESGPLYKTGGWDSSEQENNIIIKGIFTTPKYARMFAHAALKDTREQLLLIKLPRDFGQFGTESSPGRFMKLHLPKEVKAYSTSRQNVGILTTNPWSTFHLIFLTISCLGVTVVYFNRGINRTALYIYLFAVSFIVCNAFVTATFANVLDRLQYRIFWVITAINTAVIMSTIWSPRNKG